MTGETSVVEKLPQVMAHPDYYAALDYTLKVQTLNLGQSSDEDRRQTIELPLGDGADITEEVEGRRWSIVWDHGPEVSIPNTLVVETDQRGPAHGIDAWLGQTLDSNDDAGVVPEHAVERVEVVEGVSDDA